MLPENLYHSIYPALFIAGSPETVGQLAVLAVVCNTCAAFAVPWTVFRACAFKVIDFPHG